MRPNLTPEQIARLRQMGMLGDDTAAQLDQLAAADPELMPRYAPSGAPQMQPQPMPQTMQPSGTPEELAAMQGQAPMPQSVEPSGSHAAYAEHEHRKQLALQSMAVEQARKEHEERAVMADIDEHVTKPKKDEKRGGKFSTGVAGGLRTVSDAYRGV